MFYCSLWVNFGSLYHFTEITSFLLPPYQSRVTKSVPSVLLQPVILCFLGLLLTYAYNHLFIFSPIFAAGQLWNWSRCCGSGCQEARSDRDRHLGLRRESAGRCHCQSRARGRELSWHWPHQRQVCSIQNTLFHDNDFGYELDNCYYLKVFRFNLETSMLWEVLPAENSCSVFFFFLLWWTSYYAEYNLKLYMLTAKIMYKTQGLFNF